MFAGNNPMEYHVWGTMLEAYHKHPAEPKTVVELKNMLQTVVKLKKCCSQSGTDRQGYEGNLKATELCCSWGWTAWTFSVTAILWIRICNVLWCRLNNGIFAMRLLIHFWNVKKSQCSYATMFINSDILRSGVFAPQKWHAARMGVNVVWRSPPESTSVDSTLEYPLQDFFTIFRIYRDLYAGLGVKI